MVQDGGRAALCLPGLDGAKKMGKSDRSTLDMLNDQDTV